MKTARKHETWGEKSTEFGHLLMLKYGHIVLHMCRIEIGAHIAWPAELQGITIVEDSELARTTRGRWGGGRRCPWTTVS